MKIGDKVKTRVDFYLGEDKIHKGAQGVIVEQGILFDWLWLVDFGEDLGRVVVDEDELE